MGRLKYYLRRYWRRYFFGAFCLLVTATLVMWIPWWIREAVRIIEQGGSLSDVTFYAGLIGAAALAQGVVRTYSRALIFNAGRNVEYDLRNDLFAHLQKLPVSFYQSQRTGDLMSRLINDISAVRVMLGPGVLNFVNAPLYFIYALALMFSMDARMTLGGVGAVSCSHTRGGQVSRPDHETLPGSAAADCRCSAATSKRILAACTWSKPTPRRSSRPKSLSR